MAKFIDNSPYFKKECEEAIQRALEEIGLRMERNAALEIENNPRRVDTGRLRNSITHATHEFGGTTFYADNNGNAYADGGSLATPEKGEVYVGTNVEYAPYVHDGTWNMAPNAFLKNAVAGHTAEYREILERELKG